MGATPGRVRTRMAGVSYRFTSAIAPSGTWDGAWYMMGVGPISSRSRTSPTTPTISVAPAAYAGPSPGPMTMVCPTGLEYGQDSFALAWLMTTVRPGPRPGKSLPELRRIEQAPTYHRDTKPAR